MRSIYILGLTICLYFSYADAASCEAGWGKYKDELCIKSFATLSTYADAKIICGNLNGATLVMVKDAAIHDFLEDYTQGIFDNIWLGGKYDEASGQFKWDDGEPLTFTDWHEGYPRNLSDPDACIELRPENAKQSTTSNGRWADVTCQKRNTVMCQKASSWSLEDSIEEIKRLRKQHEEDVDKLLDILSQTEGKLSETIEETKLLRQSQNEQQLRLNQLQETLGRTEQRLAETTASLNSLRENAVTDIRLINMQGHKLWNAGGIPDTPSFVITGVVNDNSDEFVDWASRRQVQKLTNGNWADVTFA